MNTTSTEVRMPPVTPRVVAISGVVFSMLFILSLVLIRLVVPADPADPGEWLADVRLRHLVRQALNLIPFTGITFLWFMGVLRNRVGLREDRFLATVFLGSGFLFVAMLFASAAVSGATLDTFAVADRPTLPSETYAFARRLSFMLINPFAIRMAAVFVFVTSTIALRTAFLPRWLAFNGFAVGLILLVVITDFAWIALLFPLWVLLVSTYILVTESCR